MVSTLVHHCSAFEATRRRDTLMQALYLSFMILPRPSLGQEQEDNNELLFLFSTSDKSKSSFDINLIGLGNSASTFLIACQERIVPRASGRDKRLSTMS